MFKRFTISFFVLLFAVSLSLFAFEMYGTIGSEMNEDGRSFLDLAEASGFSAKYTIFPEDDDPETVVFKGKGDVYFLQSDEEQFVDLRDDNKCLIYEHDIEFDDGWESYSEDYVDLLEDEDASGYKGGKDFVKATLNHSFAEFLMSFSENAFEYKILFDSKKSKKQNVTFLGRKCVKRTATFKHSDYGKLNIESIIDSKTGITLKFMVTSLQVGDKATYGFEATAFESPYHDISTSIPGYIDENVGSRSL